MAQYTLEYAEQLRTMYNASVANGLMTKARCYERRYNAVMTELGFCPSHVEAMPCIACGAGL